MTDFRQDPDTYWPLRDLFGRAHKANPSCVLHTLSGRQGLAFVASIIAVLIIADPLQMQNRVGALIMALVYGLLLPIYGILHWVFLSWRPWLEHAQALAHWPVPISSFVCAALVIVPLMALTFGASWTTILRGTLAYAFVMALFEMMFLRCVMAPPAASNTEVPDQDSAEPQVDALFIGGHAVDQDQLIAIEAQEHHLRVVLRDREFTVRARLRDVIAQASLSTGIQPHRSWWVAACAVAELTREEGRPGLRLVNGQTVPVARARLPEVKTWLGQG